jgi:thiamine-monophosphate kinase
MTIERDWINRLQQHWPQADLRQDTFYDPLTRQIVTTDMLVEGVHFSWDYCSPDDVGWRSVAVNLSDIAATAGIPTWVLVSIGVPQETDISMLSRIHEGIEACCKAYGAMVVGGDTVRSPITTVSVTILGRLPQQSQPGRRHLAQPGDLLVVSGPHGLSAAGLLALQHNLPGYAMLKEAHLRPRPQLRLGQRVGQVLSRFAMMDSSDGLADAVLRLAEASQVDIVIDERRITHCPELLDLARQQSADPMDWVLYGGEDFQLVVTIAPETLGVFPELVPIGMVQPASHLNQGRAFLQTGNAVSLIREGKTFQHFAAAGS